MRKLYLLIALSLISACSQWPPNVDNTMGEVSPFQEGLTARYFGASTLLISDGKTSILIDGFFTRPDPFEAAVFGMKSDYDALEERIRYYDIDAVLISHDHFDHILDSGNVACIKEATLYGASTAIGIASDQIMMPKSRCPRPAAEQISMYTVVSDEQQRIGEFTVTFYATRHSTKKWLSRSGESIYMTVSRGGQYKCAGTNFSYLITHPGYPKSRILVVPSAGDPGETLSGVEADVVFLSVGLLSTQSDKEIRNYWSQTVERTNAKAIIPIHWDNLSGTVLKPPPIFIDNPMASISTLGDFNNGLNERRRKEGKKPVCILFPPSESQFRIDGEKCPIATVP